MLIVLKMWFNFKLKWRIVLKIQSKYVLYNFLIIVLFLRHTTVYL